MAETEKDSSDNLSRRYRRLFRLPTLGESILYASIPTVILELIVRSVLKAPVASILLLAVTTELALLLSVEIDRQALKRRGGVGTYRRLASIAIISNSLWLVLEVLALILFLATQSEGRFIALTIVGLFVAMSFRAFIFGSVFYGNTAQGLPLSVVQPLLIALPIMLLLPIPMKYEFPVVSAVSAGILYLIAMEWYLYSLNNTAPVGGLKPLQLLQAFLSAWTLEDATKVEDILDRVSKPTKVSTASIRIGGSLNGENALLIVPGIHPGPFYPIGSSNLPADIYLKLRTSETVPLTLHSISDHDLNLPSKSEVDNFVSSLPDASQVDAGKSVTLPVVEKEGKATVTGIEFGSTCLIALTQAPYGMEDFPPEVRKEIEDEASKLGDKLALVIDTHNSEGAKPNETECRDAINAAKRVLKKLKEAKQFDFRVGFSHSSELGLSMPKDVGPAGVGLLYFEIVESKFCFMVVDANNSKLGFREDVFREFEKITGVKILELCTSDTHVTAAKTSSAKGYLALGDLISVENFVSVLGSLFSKAKSRAGTGSFSSSNVTSRVKTIGNANLSDFSGIMDSTSLVAKRGAGVLGILGVAVIIVVAII